MEFLIREYVNKLTEQNIREFANKNGINPPDEEIKIIYLYIKNYWQVFYKGNAKDLFAELQEKLSPSTYDMAIKLFNKYKSKI